MEGMRSKIEHHLELTIPPTTSRIAVIVRRYWIDQSLGVADLPALRDLEILKCLEPLPHDISHRQRQSLG